MSESMIRPQTANAVSSSVFPVWTVYENPSDFPGMFVARKFEVARGSALATAEHHVAKTLEAVREKIPGMAHRMPRQPADDPCIVECWI